MKTRTAVIRETPGKWEIVDIDLEEPRQGELLIDGRLGPLPLRRPHGDG